MFYRETGQFKSKYKEELAAFPLAEDKVGIAILLVIAYVFIPIFGIPGLSYDFTMGAIMIPVFIFTITTLGLNILLGFAGQISLGTGAFMGVGATGGPPSLTSSKMAASPICRDATCGAGVEPTPRLLAPRYADDS